MKNPCDICIVKVTCTSVCSEKINYRALISNAVVENTIHSRTGTPRGTKFVNYCKKKNQNETEITKITIRKYEKRGERDDSISRQVRESFRNAQ